MLYIWESDHAPEAVLERLTNLTFPDHLLRLNFTTGAFLHMESDMCFRLCYRTAFTKNSFARELHGSILPAPGGGSRIEAESHLPLGTTLFLCASPVLFVFTLFGGLETLFVTLPVCVAFLLGAIAFRKPADELLQVLDAATEGRRTTQSNRQDV